MHIRASAAYELVTIPFLRYQQISACGTKQQHYNTCCNGLSITVINRADIIIIIITIIITVKIKTNMFT